MLSGKLKRRYIRNRNIPHTYYMFLLEEKEVIARMARSPLKTKCIGVSMKIMMKRLIAVLFIAGFLVPNVLFAEERKDVDSFLKTYEEFVIKCEKAAKSGNVMDLIDLASKGEELDKKQKKIKNSKHWTKKDDEKMLTLTVRLAAAMEKLSNSIQSLDSFGF
jgi:hypothetical protein